MRSLKIAVVVLSILTVLFAFMAFLPESSPIKPPAARTVTQANAEDETRDIATRFSEAIANYDYRRVSETIRRAQAFTTPSFSQNYQAALRGDVAVFRQRVIQTRAVATADVKGTAVQSLDDETATVLVFAAQTLRTREEPRPQTRFVAFEVALLKTGDGWKVDSLRRPTGVSGTN